MISWADIFIGHLLANAEPTLEPAVRTVRWLCVGHRPQGWACSSTEGSGAGFPGSVEKNLFVFSAMWLGEGVFQSGVRFVLGFGETGCMVLEVLVVPGDDTISITHHHLVWPSAKPWSLQKLSAAPSSCFAKLSLFSNATPIRVPAVLCFLRIDLTPGTWQPPNPLAAFHLQMQKWFLLYFKVRNLCQRNKSSSSSWPPVYPV